MKREHIQLTCEERKALERYSTTGIHSVRIVNRAKIILALDTSEGRKASKQGEISERLGVSRQTVNIAKRDYLAAENVHAFLQRKKRETPPRTPKITGEVEARIVALACSQVPEGCSRWTLKLLKDKSIELQFIDEISERSIGRLLKKRNLSLI